MTPDISTPGQDDQVSEESDRLTEALADPESAPPEMWANPAFVSGLIDDGRLPIGFFDFERTSIREMDPKEPPLPERGVVFNLPPKGTQRGDRFTLHFDAGAYHFNSSSGESRGFAKTIAVSESVAVKLIDILRGLYDGEQFYVEV